MTTIDLDFLKRWQEENLIRRVEPDGVSRKSINIKRLLLLVVLGRREYMGVDFLDFLHSGEKGVHAFAESRRGRGRRPGTSESQPLPVAGATD